MIQNNSVVNINADPRLNKRRPEWLRIRLGDNVVNGDTTNVIAENKLNTVCHSARCPNQGECWSRGTATFMILGDICTRGCKFCAIATGKPEAVDADEPVRVADAAKRMGLKFVVLTSVDRDDLPDGGADHFVKVISAIRNVLPEVGIEALVPDFKGKPDAVEIILQQPPDILNHNIETVPRLYRRVRPGANYDGSLNLIRQFSDNGLITKSGLFMGVGETDSEMKSVLGDLRKAGCRSLTIGQYLQPSSSHLSVERFIHPDDFAEMALYAESIGFDHVSAGPLVRSSYHAEEAMDVYKQFDRKR